MLCWSPRPRLRKAGPEEGRLKDAAQGAGREQASEAVGGPSGVPKSCLLEGRRRAKRSPRLRLPAAAEKSQNFFSSSPDQPVPPPAPPPLPAVAAAAAGAAATRLGLRGLGLLLRDFFLAPGRGRPSGRLGAGGGVPRRGRPPCPRPGASPPGGSAAEEGAGQPGARRAAAAGTGRGGGGFEAAPAPPRKRVGRGRPPGRRHRGAGPPSSSRVGGLRGGPLSPGGRGRAPRLRPTNGVLPPGGRALPKWATGMCVVLRAVPGSPRK